jgi:hypothetical protein
MDTKKLHGGMEDPHFSEKNNLQFPLEFTSRTEKGMRNRSSSEVYPPAYGNGKTYAVC